ncbi:hypothetical protein J3486_04450 [Streptomyces sp. VRA16 Mangrove soil]|nr:hypothetical protein [Streptomyces sp. VRA16 Mangrove soil]
MSGNPDPDPRTTTGLEPGGGVPPGGAGPEETRDSTRGRSAGPLIAIGVLVLLFAAFFLMYAVSL